MAVKVKQHKHVADKDSATGKAAQDASPSLIKSVYDICRVIQ